MHGQNDEVIRRYQEINSQSRFSEDTFDTQSESSLRTEVSEFQDKRLKRDDFGISLAERYAASEQATSWMGQRVVTDEQINAQLESANSEIFSGKSLSFSKRVKRKKAFAEKSKVQTDMLMELGKAATHRRFAIQDIGVAAAKMYPAEKKMTLADDRFAEAQRDIAAYYDILGQTDKGAQMYYNLGRVGSDVSLDQAAKEFVMEVYNADLSEFKYTNDREFTDTFSTKYEKLKAYTRGEEMYQHVLNVGTIFDKNFDEFKYRAKIKLIKEMFDDYDSRMKIIQSPYYALTAGKDYESMKPEQLEDMAKNAQKPELKSYLMAIAQKKQHKGFTEKDDPNELLVKYTETEKTEDAKAGLLLVDELMREINQVGLTLNVSIVNSEENARFCFNAYLDNEVRATVKHIGHRECRTQAPQVGSSINSMFPADLLQMNIQMEDLLEGKNVNGVEWSGQVLDEAKVLQDGLLIKQTRLARVAKKTEMIDEMKRKLNLRNPKYSTEQRTLIRKMLSIINTEEDEVALENQNALKEYGEAVFELGKFRCEHGVVLSQGKDLWEEMQKKDRKVKADAVIKVQDEEVPVYTSQFTELAPLVGKTITPADGVSAEDLKTAIDEMKTATRTAVDCNAFLQENNRNISGVMIPDTEWYRDKVNVAGATAVQKFLGMVKVS